MFCFFGHGACGILAPRPGIEPAPPALVQSQPLDRQGSPITWSFALNPHFLLYLLVQEEEGDPTQGLWSLGVTMGLPLNLAGQAVIVVTTAMSQFAFYRRGS